MDPVEERGQPPATADWTRQNIDASAVPGDAAHTSNGAAAQNAAPESGDDRHWLIRLRDSARVVLTALLLAFVFRAFFVEPFIIPTGSMAPGLLGDHWSARCPVCGSEFDVNADDIWDTEPPPRVACGNCRNLFDSKPFLRRVEGDRILVHKWPPDLVSPERWDVIVFRDPVLPQQNYIKRVIALPGESIEIRQGDVWINGAVARKPRAAQEVLWIPVFSQDLPPDPDPLRDSLSSRWVETGPSENSAWSGLDSRVLDCQPADERDHSIYFVSDRAGEYQHDFLSNNNRSSGALVRDVRIAAEVVWPAGSRGRARLELKTPPWTWSLETDASGEALLVCEESGAVLERRQLRLAPPSSSHGRSLQLEIGHLDRRFYARCEGQEVGELDLGAKSPADASAMLEASRVQVTGGGGCFALHHVRLDRDIYYTHSHRMIRAAEGEPFTLNAEEYFVLGDNSPDSHDSREWAVAGPHHPADYRLGTVRRSEIVGRAALVYLPGAWHAWFVNLGRVRFIR